jgi:pimeloyl-ACP methyl ester carboxylesterase
MAPSRIVRDLTARGVRIRVVDAGQGPAVVLLHDLLVSHLAFDRVMDGLGTEFRVLAPDLPGFGESEKPPPTRYPYGIEAFSESVVDLIAGLELGRVSVVGHSLGGATAIALAADHPELVERLVLVDPMVYPFRLDFLSRVLLLPLVGGFFFKQLYGRRAFRRFFREHFYAPDAFVSAERIDRYYGLVNAPAARESAHAVLQAIADTRPVVARIPRIVAPTLVMWGRLDRMFPPSLGNRLAREIAGARLEVLDTGHAPNEECPEEFIRIVRTFLRRT